MMNIFNAKGTNKKEGPDLSTREIIGEQIIEPKYPKPKILLLDFANDALKTLASKGFTVSSGTLGKPYRITKTGGFQPLIGRWRIPNYTEQEIVIVDLNYKEFDNGPQGEKHFPDSESDIWVKCNKGFADPRVRSSIELRESFNRIYLSGGVFVIFADPRTHIENILGRMRYDQFEKVGDVWQDVWNFLEELDDAQIVTDQGCEMQAVGRRSPLQNLLAEYLTNGRFSCTLKGGYRGTDNWETLAENKYGQPVSICRCRGAKGSVIILPQITDKAGFIAKLITEVLPEISPHLFPYISQGSWTHRPEYELSEIIKIKAKQEKIEQHGKAEIARLENEVTKERLVNGWMHDLLTGTDAQLVAAVKQALATLGFSKVIDVDAERDKEGKSRREDLQIQDMSSLLIVDVKGIAAFPRDEDVLQADKHASMRMKELKRHDIDGLTIINHQRHLPPLERDNIMPFRQELIDAAEEGKFGMMTAFDLYRLARNLKKIGWRPEYVKPLLYEKGRIGIVPKHYRYIGTIEKVWRGKFGVRIAENELRVGNRIAVEFSIEFEEVEVGSIQVNSKQVETAVPGDPAGLVWPEGKPKLDEGMKVFRIETV